MDLCLDADSLDVASLLGSDDALEKGLEKDPARLRQMLDQWPFFRVYIAMLEMVLAKADASIAEHYEQRLCDDEASWHRALSYGVG